MLIKNILNVCLSILSIFSPIYGDQEVESAESAIRIALDNRSIVQSRHYETRKSQTDNWVALSGYFPQFTVSSIYGNDTGLLLPPSQTIFEIKQLLFSFAGPIEEYRIAQHDSAITHFEEDITRREVRRDAALRYFDLWAARVELPAIYTLADRAEFDLKKSHAEYNSGLLAEIDWKQALAAYAHRTSHIKDYNFDVVSREAWFARVLEEKATVSVTAPSIELYVRDAIDALQKHSQDYYLKHGLTRRAIIAKYDEMVMKQQALKKYYACSYIPTISFIGLIENGMFFVGTILEPAHVRTYWQYGICIEWKFDGLANAHRYHGAQLEEIASEFAAQDIREQVKVEVITAYQELAKMITDLHAQEVLFERAKTAYHNAQVAYRVGMISEVEFKDAKNMYENSQYELHAQEAQTAKAHQDLLYASAYPS